MRKIILIPMAVAVFAGTLASNGVSSLPSSVVLASAHADDGHGDGHGDDDDDDPRPPRQRPDMPQGAGRGQRDFPPPPPGMMPGPPPRPGWLLGLTPEDHDEARAALQAGQIVSLRAILEVAERDFQGQMLEAELEHHDDAWRYELKMLAPDGSILKLYYNAERPELMKAKGHGLLSWYKGDRNTLPPALEEARRRMESRHGDGDKDEGRRRGPGWFSSDGPPPLPQPSSPDAPGRDGKAPEGAPPPPPAGPPPAAPERAWYDRWLGWIWE